MKNIDKIMPKHITIKLFKNSNKEKILKAAGEKGHVIYRRSKIRVKTDLLSETIQARRQRSNILKDLKEKKNISI